MNTERIIRIIAFFLTMLVAKSALASDQKILPLPPPSQFSELRVVILNNPRHVQIEISDISEMLRRATRFFEFSFGLKISFAELKQEKIDSIDRYLSARQKQEIVASKLDLLKDQNVAILAQTLKLDLLSEKAAMVAITKFAGRASSEFVDAKSISDISNRVAKIHSELNREWRSVTLGDGRPLLDDELYSEYNTWLQLGYTNLPYEVVITNQPIISAERGAASLHSSLRGGLTNGLTNSSWKSRNGAFSVLSLFAMYSDDPATLRLRNNIRQTKNKAIDSGAAILIHELGHQLLHLGHPFENEKCVMRPPVRLHFDGWLKEIDSRFCPLNSSMEMTPGRTVQFLDLRR